MTPERNVQFSAPVWLRDLGFSSWLLVGFVLIIVGLIWLVAETSTIVMPVILATVIGAVAGPWVGWMEGHRIPRAGGAALVLLASGCNRSPHLLPRLRRHIRPSGRHLGEAQPVAGQDPERLQRPRSGQHAGRQGERAERCARDPDDSAERGGTWHLRPVVNRCSSLLSQRSAHSSCSRTGRSCIASSIGIWACPNR